MIDDDLDISESIKAIIQDEGFEVVCTSNGLEGLHYLHQCSDLPALILLDIMMPKMNGYEFRIEQLKDPLLAQIPTVVFTAAGRFEDEGIYKFNATIKKPMDLEHLLDIVHQYLKN